MDTQYTFHEDSGHGWLEVKRAELISLGILDQISHYSYQDGDTVYLEEDCDLERFCIAKNIKTFSDLNANRSYSESSDIRGYGRFRKTPNQKGK